MREIKTDYYDRFTCIADKCSITCCQEWKIAVDNTTFKKWKKLSLSENNVDKLNHYVINKDGGKVIGLNKEKKCPFLNEEELCKLVIKYGDGALSKTCASFPREIHEFEDRTEYSLVSCCPEVVDILNNISNVELVGISDIQKFSNVLSETTFIIRDIFINIVKHKELSVTMGLKVLFYIALEILNKSKALTDEDMNVFIKENKSEYTDEKNIGELLKAINALEKNKKESFYECNELFLDLAENYRKEGLYLRYLDELYVFAESISEDENMISIDEIDEFEQEFSKYDMLFKNYLVSELFTNLLLPESNIEDLIVMLEWIAIEYAVIKHSVFLKWHTSDKNMLIYEEVRDMIVVISRMTGYDEEDIHEYMENCFQNIVWEWGYMSLILV